MSPIVPHESRIVDAPLPALAAIECRTLHAFVQAARLASVLIAEIEYQTTLPHLHEHWEIRFAVHLTARSVIDADRPVCYATFLAAIVQGASTSGQLVFPYQRPHLEGSLLVEARRLTTELRSCLVRLLEQQPSLIGIRDGARYALPEAYVWGMQSEAAGIVLRERHWVLQSPSS